MPQDGSITSLKKESSCPVDLVHLLHRQKLTSRHAAAVKLAAVLRPVLKQDIDSPPTGTTRGWCDPVGESDWASTHPQNAVGQKARTNSRASPAHVLPTITLPANRGKRKPPQSIEHPTREEPEHKRARLDSSLMSGPSEDIEAANVLANDDEEEVDEIRLWLHQAHRTVHAASFQKLLSAIGDWKDKRSVLLTRLLAVLITCHRCSPDALITRVEDILRSSPKLRDQFVAFVRNSTKVTPGSIVNACDDPMELTPGIPMNLPDDQPMDVDLNDVDDSIHMDPVLPLPQSPAPNVPSHAPPGCYSAPPLLVQASQKRLGVPTVTLGSSLQVRVFGDGLYENCPEDSGAGITWAEVPAVPEEELRPLLLPPSPLLPPESRATRPDTILKGIAEDLSPPQMIQKWIENLRYAATFKASVQLVIAEPLLIRRLLSPFIPAATMSDAVGGRIPRVKLKDADSRRDLLGIIRGKVADGRYLMPRPGDIARHAPDTQWTPADEIWFTTILRRIHAGHVPPRSTGFWKRLVHHEQAKRLTRGERQHDAAWTENVV